MNGKRKQPEGGAPPKNETLEEEIHRLHNEIGEILDAQVLAASEIESARADLREDGWTDAQMDAVLVDEVTKPSKTSSKPSKNPAPAATGTKKAKSEARAEEEAAQKPQSKTARPETEGAESDAGAKAEPEKSAPAALTGQVEGEEKDIAIRPKAVPSVSNLEFEENSKKYLPRQDEGTWDDQSNVEGAAGTPLRSKLATKPTQTKTREDQPSSSRAKDGNAKPTQPSEKACKAYWLSGKCNDSRCEFAHTWKPRLRNHREFQQLEEQGRLPARTLAAMNDWEHKQKMRRDGRATGPSNQTILRKSDASASGPAVPEQGRSREQEAKMDES